MARWTAARASGGEADEALRLRRKRYGLSEALARLALGQGRHAVHRLSLGRARGPLESCEWRSSARPRGRHAFYTR